MGSSPTLSVAGAKHHHSCSTGLMQVNCKTGFLTFWPFRLRKDCAFVWYVWKFHAVTLPILCWCHKSLALWPRVSISTLFTWSAVIWHSFRKSGAVYSRGFSFIYSDDIKLRAFWGRSSGRPSSFVCSMEKSTQADGMFLNNAIDQGWYPLISQLAILWFHWVKLVL